MDARSILLVAAETAAGAHLKNEVRRRMADGPCKFTLLVPATPPRAQATWTDEEALALAEKRASAALEGLRAIGADIEGVIGDELAADAVGDILRRRDFDEIILSTLPPGVSRWLHQDLVHKVRRRTDIPVTHIVADTETASTR